MLSLTEADSDDNNNARASSSINVASCHYW